MTGDPGPQVRLARRWFWALVVVAVAAMGGLYRAAQEPSSAAAGLGVLVSGVLLVAALTQATRILVRLDGRRPLRRLGRPRRAAKRGLTGQP